MLGYNVQRFGLPVELRDKQCSREVLQRRRRATRRTLRDVVRQLKGYKESRNANNASWSAVGSSTKPVRASFASTPWRWIAPSILFELASCMKRSRRDSPH